MACLLLLLLAVSNKNNSCHQLSASVDFTMWMDMQKLLRVSPGLSENPL